MGGFIEAVALSPTYQDQLARMAPLRSASAACLDLLGRAGTPAEVADFLQIRATAGQPAAVQSLLKRRGAEKADQAPSIQGLNTRPGQSQETVTKTASLYRGNAAINPDNNPAI